MRFIPDKAWWRKDQKKLTQVDQVQHSQGGEGGESLSQIFRSVPVPASARGFRKFMAFFGPGYLIAVGYMDPGNWATSLAGGAQFGYDLLFVIFLSNIFAILLQALAARLAIGTGQDLAQVCRDTYPPFVVYPLWISAELAMVATDLAEVVGTAIALQILFHLPLSLGILLTSTDVFLVLWLQNKGFRRMEALVIFGLGVIALCFALQIIMAQPDWAGVARGFVPNRQVMENPAMLYLALSIVGATVMPHNLYLHSALVHTRDFGASLAEKRDALHFNVLDSSLALMLALGINASILILAAATFHRAGLHDVADLTQAHELLRPLLGAAIAPFLFAIALLCSGLNATLTSTLAGQVVMEGFVSIKFAPWIRRLVTRFLAIVPALLVIGIGGEEKSGSLLILSQVVLSLQLPFAVFPLIFFTASRAKMKDFLAPRFLSVLTFIVACGLVYLNIKMVLSFFFGEVG